MCYVFSLANLPLRPRPRITLCILKDFTRNFGLKIESYFWTLPERNQKKQQHLYKKGRSRKRALVKDQSSRFYTEKARQIGSSFHENLIDNVLSGYERELFLRVVHRMRCRVRSLNDLARRERDRQYRQNREQHSYYEHPTGQGLYYNFTRKTNEIHMKIM